jgi:hypothetical protein
MGGKEGKTIRNAARLRKELLDILTEMEHAQRKAHHLANGDPRTAELYIQISMGKIAAIRDLLNTNYERLMRYAAPMEEDEEEGDLDEKIIHLLEDIQQRLAQLERSNHLTVLPRRDLA